MSALRVSSAIGLALLFACNRASEPVATTAAATTATATTATTTAAESSMPAPALDAAKGRDVGLVVEAYLSPHQESNEESNTPSSVPQQFRSTTPSMTRDQREAAGHRGHGQIRFSKDLSRAWVDVKVEGVDVSQVNMFHIHCGQPGILGPILVDFALATDIQQNLADGTFSVELRNEHIAKTVEQGHGSMIGAFTRGCIIESPSLESTRPSKVMTIGGMADLALQRQLYFNLHTTGQVYYGDIRGQLYPVTPVE